MFRTQSSGLFRKARNSARFQHPGGMDVRLRGLTRRDAAIYSAHLLRLSPEDRRARFHGLLSDGGVAAHARTLDWDHALVFGAFVDGELRGVGELLPAADSGYAEAAFSVEPDFQHASIGRILMAALLVAARVAGIREVRIAFLRNNAAMRALARDIGAHIVSAEDGVESVVHLPLSA